MEHTTLRDEQGYQQFKQRLNPLTSTGCRNYIEAEYRKCQTPSERHELAMAVVRYQMDLAAELEYLPQELIWLHENVRYKFKHMSFQEKNTLVLDAMQEYQAGALPGNLDLENLKAKKAFDEELNRVYHSYIFRILELEDFENCARKIHIVLTAREVEITGESKEKLKHGNNIEPIIKKPLAEHLKEKLENLNQDLLDFLDVPPRLQHLQQLAPKQSLEWYDFMSRSKKTFATSLFSMKSCELDDTQIHDEYPFIASGFIEDLANLMRDDFEFGKSREGRLFYYPAIELIRSTLSGGIIGYAVVFSDSPTLHRTLAKRLAGCADPKPTFAELQFHDQFLRQQDSATPLIALRVIESEDGMEVDLFSSKPINTTALSFDHHKKKGREMDAMTHLAFSISQARENTLVLAVDEAPSQNPLAQKRGDQKEHALFGYLREESEEYSLSHILNQCHKARERVGKAKKSDWVDLKNIIDEKVGREANHNYSQMPLKP